MTFEKVNDFQGRHLRVIESGLVGSSDLWEGYCQSRRCSRDTYPVSYITEHTSIRRKATFEKVDFREVTFGNVQVKEESLRENPPLMDETIEVEREPEEDEVPFPPVLLNTSAPYYRGNLLIRKRPPPP